MRNVTNLNAASVIHATVRDNVARIDAIYSLQRSQWGAVLQTFQNPRKAVVENTVAAYATA